MSLAALWVPARLWGLGEETSGSQLLRGAWGTINLAEKKLLSPAASPLLPPALFFEATLAAGSTLAELPNHIS